MLPHMTPYTAPVHCVAWGHKALGLSASQKLIKLFLQTGERERDRELERERERERTSKIKLKL